MLWINSSAIPSVEDCGFSLSVFSFFAGSSRGFSFGGDSVFKVLKVWVKLDKSFKKFSICSEFFSLSINGRTLSEKSGFCER